MGSSVFSILPGAQKAVKYLLDKWLRSLKGVSTPLGTQDSKIFTVKIEISHLYLFNFKVNKFLKHLKILKF